MYNGKYYVNIIYANNTHRLASGSNETKATKFSVRAIIMLVSIRLSRLCE
jgi:hypothetical protein